MVLFINNIFSETVSCRLEKTVCLFRRPQDLSKPPNLWENCTIEFNEGRPRVRQREGYRPNVGIILINERNEVFWGKRVREHSWQFPQGGIKPGESPETAMYRELYEEVGLLPQHVKIIGRTRDWLHYDVPVRWVRREWRGSYRGQKQIWYLLRLVGRDSDVNLRACHHPEFDGWRWHQYWAPVDEVIDFKRGVYLGALTELSRFLRGIESYEEFIRRNPIENL